MREEEKKFLERAIELARESVRQGGFPAGAVVVKEGAIVAEGISVGFKQNDPSGHAESVAVREACKHLGTAVLSGAVVYESVECCLMCFATCVWAGVGKIVYAAKKSEEMVTKGYYEGRMSVEEVNERNLKKMELVHAGEMESAAMEVIREWEKKGGFEA